MLSTIPQYTYHPNNQIKFWLLDIGENFYFNGTSYHKVSPRTARLNGYGSQVYYFSKNELVEVESKNQNIGE